MPHSIIRQGPLRLTTAQYLRRVDEDEGICRHCGSNQGPIEPDARMDRCHHCGVHEVYGTEELLTMGEIEITDGH